jgi:hypothetical protein
MQYTSGCYTVLYCVVLGCVTWTFNADSMTGRARHLLAHSLTLANDCNFRTLAPFPVEKRTGTAIKFAADDGQGHLRASGIHAGIRHAVSRRGYYLVQELLEYFTTRPVPWRITICFSRRWRTQCAVCTNSANSGFYYEIQRSHPVLSTSLLAAETCSENKQSSAALIALLSERESVRSRHVEP